MGFLQSLLTRWQTHRGAESSSQLSLHTERDNAPPQPTVTSPTRIATSTQPQADDHSYDQLAQPAARSVEVNSRPIAQRQERNSAPVYLKETTPYQSISETEIRVSTPDDEPSAFDDPHLADWLETAPPSAQLLKEVEEFNPIALALHQDPRIMELRRLKESGHEATDALYDGRDPQPPTSQHYALSPSEWSQLETQTAHLKTQTAQFKDQATQLETQTERLENRAAQLETQVAHRSAQLIELEQRTHRLELENTQLRKALAQLEKQNMLDEEQTAHLRFESVQFQSQNAKLELKITQVHKRNSQLQYEMSLLRSYLQRQEKRSETFETQLAECQRRIAQLDAKLNPVKSSHRRYDIKGSEIPLLARHTSRWVLVLSLIFLGGLYLWIMSAGQWRTASLKLDDENRTAANAPSFTLSALFSGSLRRDLEQFVSDRFGGRSGLIAIGQRTQKSLSARHLITPETPVKVHVNFKALATGERASQEYDEVLGDLLHDAHEQTPHNSGDTAYDTQHSSGSIEDAQPDLELSPRLDAHHKQVSATEINRHPEPNALSRSLTTESASQVTLQRRSSKSTSSAPSKRTQQRYQAKGGPPRSSSTPEVRPDPEIHSQSEQKSARDHKRAHDEKGRSKRGTQREQHNATPAVINETHSSSSSTTRKVELKNNRGSIIIHNKMAMVRYLRTRPRKYSMYAKMINLWRRVLPKDIKVYSVLVPNSAGIYAPETGPFRTSSQDVNIKEHHSKMSPSVIKVNGYGALKSHADEHIFFKSDHHWTARGAYYVYQQLVHASGLTPTPLSQLKRVIVAHHWRGSYWGLTRGAPELKEGDLIEAFLPITTYVGRHWVGRDPEGPHRFFERPWFRLDRKAYTAFVGSSYTRIQADTSVKNGRKILVVMNSYGNALVTLLLNNYESVIGIDYRYYQKSLKRLILKEKVTDVVFLNGVMSANGRYCHRRLRKLLYPGEKR